MHTKVDVTEMRQHPTARKGSEQQTGRLRAVTPQPNFLLNFLGLFRSRQFDVVALSEVTVSWAKAFKDGLEPEPAFTTEARQTRGQEVRRCSRNLAV